jgi:hypothetical protein
MLIENFESEVFITKLNKYLNYDLNYDAFKNDYFFLLIKNISLYYIIIKNSYV